MATRRHFSREFKVEAVKLATERGVSIAQAARGYCQLVGRSSGRALVDLSKNAA